MIAAVEDGPDQAEGRSSWSAPEARARVVTTHGSAELAAELQEHVRARLSKHKYPRWIVFVDDLPKNDRGKVDKKALAAREAAGELAP